MDENIIFIQVEMKPGDTRDIKKHITISTN